ncbi:hypothetical protein ACFSKU_03080 [Pontibacter silvestris]|uniref:DUF304 domain-containing protein n=1 Tax=Pontibacter silvestris TaxID=2305183 RepID=A0ABW4WSV9_9BACT|nr:hypothetical protein [Pontibacter silvestris]MCC9138118.1 hypothetical protein [Pontibacter silvestris]
MPLYPPNQKRKTQNFIRLAGAFFTVGGGVALLREFFIEDLFRLSWAVDSGLLLLLGVLFLERVKLKDAYFSMDTDYIRYRLTLVGRERELSWNMLKGIRVSEHVVLFEMNDGQSLAMRLGNIQDPLVALHVARSLQLVALEKGIIVNGVKTGTIKAADK